MDPNSPPSPCNSSMQNTESCAKVAVWTHRNRTEGLKENIGTFWASLESFCFRHVYPPSFEVNVCLQSSIWSIECLANYWTKRNHMRCFHKAPSYDHIKVFSTLCFAHNKKTKHKFAPRGRRCLFVGYPFGQKGWKLLNLEIEEYFVSHDIIFHENIFPFAAMVEPSEPHSPSRFAEHFPASHD